MGKHSMTGRLGSMLRRRGTGRGGAPRGTAPGEDAGYLRDLGYRPNMNQVRHEPMPASAHAEQRQDAVLRSAELGSASAAEDEKTHRTDRGED